MNKNLYTLYVVIVDNEVIHFETNLTLFVEQFSKKEPQSRNYDWFYRRFKIKTHFSQVIGDKTYYFQKVV